MTVTTNNGKFTAIILIYEIVIIAVGDVFCGIIEIIINKITLEINVIKLTILDICIAYNTDAIIFKTKKHVNILFREYKSDLILTSVSRQKSFT